MASVSMLGPAKPCTHAQAMPLTKVRHIMQATASQRNIDAPQTRLAGSLPCKLDVEARGRLVHIGRGRQQLQRTRCHRWQRRHVSWVADGQAALHGSRLAWTREIGVCTAMQVQAVDYSSGTVLQGCRLGQSVQHQQPELLLRLTTAEKLAVPSQHPADLKPGHERTRVIDSPSCHRLLEQLLSLLLQLPAGASRAQGKLPCVIGGVKRHRSSEP